MPSRTASRRAGHALWQLQLPLQQPSNQYVCRSCRAITSSSTATSSLRATRPSPSQIQTQTHRPGQRRHASSDNIPLTEKIRRKIWGTDNPPGLKDPYGGPSFLERAAEKRRAQREDGQDGAATARAAGRRQAIEEFEAGREGRDVERDVERGTPPEADGSPVPLEKYVPAETWDGLRHLGHTGHWKELEPVAEDNYAPWLSSANPASNYQELVSCLHQAIVECLTCKKANVDPAAVNRLHSDSYTEDVNLAQVKLNLTTSETSVSNAEVRFEDAEVEGYVNTLLEEAAATAPSAEDVSAEHGAEQPGMFYIVQDESFLESTLDFDDPVTFSILKRFSQLSGHRVSDSILNNLVPSSVTPTPTPTSATNLFYLLDQVYASTVKPKPRNLAEILSSDNRLKGQGNIKIMSRRETPVDKEKEIGRWKVIEKELRAKGLPVLGRPSAQRQY